MTLSLALNTVACACVFWVAGAFLVTRDRPTYVSDVALLLGLLLAMCGAMIAGLAPFRYGLTPAWWHLMFRSGAALIALVLYDLAFGIHAQFFHAVEPIRTAPERLRRWWHRALAIAHDHAASTKRTSP